MSESLIKVMAELAEHTLPECKNNCKIPLSCCDRSYCEMTMDYAREEWGIVLIETGHETLPLMGPGGCVASPHLRPLCTMHTCAVNSHGFKPGDEPWTKRYFELREKAVGLMSEKGRNDEDTSKSVA